MLRAGAGYAGSPYSQDRVDAKYNSKRITYALGAGIRENDYFIDLGYQNVRMASYHLPYNLEKREVEGAYIKTGRGEFSDHPGE